VKLTAITYEDDSYLIAPYHAKASEKQNQNLALMPQADTKLERLLAQRTNRPLHLLRNLVYRRPGL